MKCAGVHLFEDAFLAGDRNLRWQLMRSAELRGCEFHVALGLGRVRLFVRACVRLEFA